MNGEERRFEGEYEILGHKLRLELIRNPNIVRAIKERAGDFLFNYGDHTEHSDRHSDSPTYGDYYDHTESSRKKRVDTHGTGTHTDETKEEKGYKSSGSGGRSHRDHVEYSDYSAF